MPSWGPFSPPSSFAPVCAPVTETLQLVWKNPYRYPKKKKNCHWEPGQLQQLRNGSLVWQYKYKQFSSRKDAGTPLRLQVARESREQKLNCLFCLEQAQKVEQISFPSYLGEVAELQPHFFVLRESTVKWHHSKPSYIPGLFSNHHSKLPFFFFPLPVLPPLSSNFCF